MAKIAVALSDSENAQVYEGDYEVTPGPDGILLIYEVVPDVTGKSKEGKIMKLRTIYNSHAWDQTIVRD